MRQHKTAAVILNTTDTFDADRSLLLFTEALGKVRARAKGVRKPTSKLTGHLLPYLPTQLELVEGSAGLLITQAQSLVTYSEEALYPANALLFLQQAELIAEALNKVFVEQDPHPDIYHGLVYTLDRLRVLCSQEDETMKARLVTAEFLFKAWAELGYRAELHQCVISGAPLKEGAIGWNSQAGGVVCADTSLVNVAVRPVRSARTVVLLREFLKPEFVAERVATDTEVKAEACQLIYDYLQTQIGQPLRAL